MMENDEYAKQIRKRMLKSDGEKKTKSDENMKHGWL